MSNLLGRLFFFEQACLSGVSAHFGLDKSGNLSSFNLRRQFCLFRFCTNIRHAKRSHFVAGKYRQDNQSERRKISATLFCRGIYAS
jgi:hypothetical protein